MIPWVHLDTAPLPGGRGDLRLMQRGREFSIMLGSNELMNSRLSGSEEALASLACERIQDRSRARMLIGGLGMGFTLRAALANLGEDAEVTAAELVPAVVSWGRGPMAEVFASSLSDPRVTIEEDDVRNLIAAARSRYDAILLDVDNGPEGLTTRANDGLYDREGLSAAWKALVTGGVLGVWSSGPNASFAARLKQTGFEMDEVRVRANGKRGGARHVLWFAVKPG